MLHIDSWPSCQSDFLQKTHLWKLAEAVRWLNGIMWVLWNDICRCPREIRQVSILESQLTVRIERSVSGAPIGWAPHSVNGPQQAACRVPPGREAAVPSGALKITQRGRVKEEELMGQCGSLHPSLSVRLSLSHYRSFHARKNKESYVF